MGMVSAARRILISALAGLVPGVAAAADLPEPAPQPPPTAPAAYTPPPPPDWTVTIGVEGRTVPAWPGASFTPLGYTGSPLFSIRKSGMPPDYFGARDSFGFSILDLGVFKIGPAVKVIWSRTSSEYAQLNGLPNVNFAVQAGGFAEFWPVPWLRLRTEVRQGIGGENGLTGDAFLDVVVPFGQFRWSAGPRVTMQTTAAVSPYFSITAAQAAAADADQPTLPRLTVYDASGGLYSYGAGTQLEYFINSQWAVHGLFEYERLTDSVADSPIVTQRGSPNQYTFGLGATYSFNMHPWW
jgi:outer membrane scaffolding protein for murein synthesis (MipA/OmpV family)